MIVRTIKQSNAHNTGHISTYTEYTIIKPTTYVPVETSVITDTNLSAKTRGFFIRLAALAFSDSLIIKYNKKELCEKLSVGKTYLYSRLKELTDLGYLTTNKSGCIVISKGVIKTSNPVIKSVVKDFGEMVRNLSTDSKARVEMTLGYKAVYNSLKNNFKGISNKQMYVMSAMAGVPARSIKLQSNIYEF